MSSLAPKTNPHACAVELCCCRRMGWDSPAPLALTALGCPGRSVCPARGRLGPQGLAAHSSAGSNPISPSCNNRAPRLRCGALLLSPDGVGFSRPLALTALGYPGRSVCPARGRLGPQGLAAHSSAGSNPISPSCNNRASRLRCGALSLSPDGVGLWSFCFQALASAL